MRTVKNGFRRITAMVCALALCASMLPTAVFAEGTPDVDEAIQPATAVSQTDETDLKDTTGAIQTDGTEKDTATTDGDTTNPTNDTEETEKVDGSEDADGTDVVDGAEGEDTVLDQEQPRSPENDTEEANTEDKEEHEASSQEGVAESDQLQKAPALDLSQSETALYNADGDSRKIVDGQGEFYADPENKIWLSTRDGTLGNDQTVTFIIQMDGEEKDRVTVQNLPIYSVRLDVNAVLYDDKAWSDDSGISVTRDDSGNNGGWLISNLNPAFVNEYTVTINFTERTLKDNDAIQITDGENVYGTFFWAKGSATSCDYSRTLTVYVNDGLAYQTTIQTPRSLGVNTYWFESNLAQYTSDVRVEPDLLDSVTMKDVRVYLTTKCACRNPTCTCSGGCTCSEGCGCLACKPTQQKDTIYTPYGTITYDSDSVGVKMNLKVRLYVNGQQEYESEKFTTTNGLSGSLGFSANESAGYYFLSQAASVNSYDIFVKKAGKTEWERNSSTWWPTDSRIVLMSDDSNDEYVLCIYDSIEAASEADDPKQDALHTAYMIRQDENGKAVDNFVINESNVQVNGEDVSLLFDDIVDSTSYEYEKTLTGKAVAAVISADNSLNGATLKTEAKYLDLVESGNGNAWVTTNSKVTVYWPYPEGTDASTKFYVAHFEDLDRNAGTGEMADELEKTPATMMKVEQDAYGIYFTTDSFSPYVLVWEESQGQVTPPDDGDDDDNNTNTNTTTNNNTQNTTVNVAANNSAAAPAAAAVAIPQTGDNSQPLVWIALVGISGAALAALAVFRRKRSDK